MTELQPPYDIPVMPEPENMPMGWQSSSGSTESSCESSCCDGKGVEQDCSVTLNASGGNADADSGQIQIPITATGTSPTTGDCCQLNDPNYSFSVLEVLSSPNSNGPWESADASLSIVPDTEILNLAYLQGTLNTGGKYYQIRLGVTATWDSEETENDCENCPGCDSCNAVAETTVVAYRDCSSECDKKVTATPAEFKTYQWIIDDNKCTVTLKVRIYLEFFNPSRLLNEPVWTQNRMNNFKNRFANVIQDGWNSSGFVLHAQSRKCCPCERYKPLLEIVVSQDVEDAIIVGVMSGTKPYYTDNTQTETKGNWASGTIFDQDTTSINGIGLSMGLLENSLDNYTIQTVGKCNGNQQIPAVHEFGHLIGLEHPGLSMEPPIVGIPEEYEVDADSLMGCGMEHRITYFEKWAAVASELRKKCCASFLVGTND